MLARTPKPREAELDGIVDLPPGKIAAIATYFEMRGPPGRGRMPLPGILMPLAGDLPRYRSLYRRVGAPWLWFSRTLLTDEKLAAIIADPAVQALALVVNGRDVALVELDFRKAGECELAFFGIVPEATGRGLGPILIAEAVRRAFQNRIARLWLHTCTLDHPAATRFYLKAGFKPYRRAVEIADDPRLTGHMDRSAAPHFPIV